jgi:hypothetical protein
MEKLTAHEIVNIILLAFGSIGCAVSLFWIGVFVFTQWFYRPKKLTKVLQIKKPC